MKTNNKSKQQFKLYIFSFEHWKTKEPKQIDIDAVNQLEALAEFKKLFGKVQLKDCNSTNFNLKQLILS